MHWWRTPPRAMVNSSHSFTQPIMTSANTTMCIWPITVTTRKTRIVSAPLSTPLTKARHGFRWSTCSTGVTSSRTPTGRWTSLPQWRTHTRILQWATTRILSRRSGDSTAPISARKLARSWPPTSADGSTTTKPNRSGTSCSGCLKRTKKKRFASALPHPAPGAGTGVSTISASTASLPARCRRWSRPARPPEAREPTRCL